MPGGSNTNFHPQSGHPGVTWCSERRTWRICYAPEPGKRVTKSFNPRHYGGLEQALQAAIEYLREQKAKLSLFRPNGNSNKGENSSNINIKKVNDKLNDLHNTNNNSNNNAGNVPQDLEINNGKCINNKLNGNNNHNHIHDHNNNNNNSSWNNIQYNGFDYGSGLGNTEYNNGINSELLPGFENGKITNNQNLFSMENTNNEQWNVTAAAVIAHAITSSKANGFNQKRKANCEYSTSMRQPSNKTIKSSNIYDDNNNYFNQSNTTLIQSNNIELNNGYCCDCYSNRGLINNYKKNEDTNHLIDNNSNMLGQNTFQYQCSQSTKSTISSSNNNCNINISDTNNNNNVNANNSISPFVYDYNDQNINEVMNIRTPKYVNYQRHTGNQNVEDDLLHPSIASSSPLGRVFQSTPYSNMDNYENILTPNMRTNNLHNHGINMVGHNIDNNNNTNHSNHSNNGNNNNNNNGNNNNNNCNNNNRYYGGNIYENDVGILSNNSKVSNNNKNDYTNGNCGLNCATNNGSNHGNCSCNNCINNNLPPQNEFSDYQSPFSTWFEGLGSCYSEIEDAFLSKSSQLLPVGSLGPYSFQPYKEQNNGSDVNGKSIVESILLPLSTTSCSTSAEPQLSNELILDSCQTINLFQQNNKNSCIGDNNNPININ
ncbi:hypothetical protein FG379_001000 [Cryptosporidium bovis]|uniref:uncharacterized protein n=1 Tax=Cryptosporidium bovis TaxID=310047 RepID=UPI00351A168B|nr:hypothetical protein FG379_001000 [Cryptosporidium bovis]